MNVTAYTDTELAEILNDMARGGLPVNTHTAVSEIRFGSDRMVYKTNWSDAELNSLITRHLDFYGFED